MDRETVKLTENRCDVLVPLYRRYNGTSKGILNELKAVKGFVGKTIV